MKGSYNRIISAGEKKFDKIQCNKNTNKLGIEENFINMIRGIYYVGLTSYSIVKVIAFPLSIVHGDSKQLQ